MNHKDMQKGSVGIIVAVLAVILVGGGILFYQSQEEKNEKKTDHGMMAGEEMMMGKGVMFEGGKIVLEDDGKMSPIAGTYTFEEGITVTQSGLVTKKDGTTMQLKEGESMWGDGSLMKAGEHGMMGDAKINTSMMGAEHNAAAVKAGTYEPYAPEKIVKAETGKVVLFFHASWCTTCRALTEDIKANLNAIPENVTILDVDYDTSSALKQKYKVTTQHTLVQVDAKGNQIKQWKGSPTLADVVAQIQ
jgi:thiol-disulfide isomerase/thioredoxin